MSWERFKQFLNIQSGLDLQTTREMEVTRQTDRQGRRRWHAWSDVTQTAGGRVRSSLRREVAAAAAAGWGFIPPRSADHSSTPAENRETDALLAIKKSVKKSPPSRLEDSCSRCDRWDLVNDCDQLLRESVYIYFFPVINDHRERKTADVRPRDMFPSIRPVFRFTFSKNNLIKSRTII